MFTLNSFEMHLEFERVEPLHNVLILDITPIKSYAELLKTQSSRGSRCHLANLLTQTFTENAKGPNKMFSFFTLLEINV